MRIVRMIMDILGKLIGAAIGAAIAIFMLIGITVTYYAMNDCTGFSGVFISSGIEYDVDKPIKEHCYPSK